MPKPKKLDKKKAVTFQLVHRSQQDPLIADENAPQRVLLPVEGKDAKKHREQIEEQQKYGIFYDDDFNYLEHLKDVKDNRVEWPAHVSKEFSDKKENVLQLPSSVFPSEVEEEVGMLNKAAPVSGLQLHLDPDVVAAMDEDFNFSDPENQLEDNFIELANGVASDQEFSEDENLERGSNVCSEDIDEVGSQMSFTEEETKSRFTNYSMTSSVIKRNEQLTLLDERFEKMYATYEENEIGALDNEEIEGYVPETADILLQYAEEFEKSQKREQIHKDIISNKEIEVELDDESEEEFITVPVEEKEKWDCESILSTYSNIYNHPKLICESKQEKIVTDKKTGIPKNVLNSNRLTTKALNKLNEQNSDYHGNNLPSDGRRSLISQLSMLSIRPNNETSQERRERKKQLKEYRKERRIEKKLNTEAFKDEAKKQIKIAINNRNNVQGNKIL